MSRANSKKEQKIIREADKLISMKENVDALSWSRVQEIADELRGSSLSDQRREELARELISISQANISLSAKLGIVSDAPIALGGQSSSTSTESSEYVSPKWKPEDAPQQQDSEFFHAQKEDESAHVADIPAGENPVVIPRAHVDSAAADSMADISVKPGPTIEEVLADSSAATTHPMAPVPDDNPVTSDPLINNAAADQLASGIDKMVDDLEHRYKLRQQEKEEKKTGEQVSASSEPSDNAAQQESLGVEQELAEAQAKLNDVETDMLLERSGQKTEQAVSEVSIAEDRKDSPEDKANLQENASLQESDKKKDKKKKRKEEKKARKAEKAARKAQKEAAAKAAKQQADELEKKIIEDEQDKEGEQAPQDQPAAPQTEPSIAETASIDTPIAGEDAPVSSAQPTESIDAEPDPAATKDPEVTKMQGFATFKNVYNSRDARMSLFQDEDGHLVAVDNSKLV